jgi:glycosyltransferase involved in cell wall biosynthesis
MPHTVVMVTTSYPRFQGDNVGSFMEPIALGLAARGHRVHVVAPWHPRVSRAASENGVRLHYFRYAPVARLNVFGYAGAMRADTSLRVSALLAAPLALAAGWRAARSVARREGATIVHGHWVIPGGAIAAAARGPRPLVVSLHGSDVFVAERHAAAAWAARATFGRAAWTTACSDDLRRRAIRLGADPGRIEVVPYGVDAARFRPHAEAVAWRTRHGLGPADRIVFTAGRLVRKKGFEYLVDAVAAIAPRWPPARLVIAGAGDLDAELAARARQRGIADRVRFLGMISQDEIALALPASDVIAVPSVRDDAGNVDGLPNIVMEALASGTPLVATTAGGIASVVRDGDTGLLVEERDVAGLSAALELLLSQPERGRALAEAARAEVIREHGWERVAARFEAIYDRLASPALSTK